MAFRLLRYKTQIWERWSSEHPAARQLPMKRRIMTATIDQLDLWTTRVLSAASLGELLAD